MWNLSTKFNNFCTHVLKKTKNSLREVSNYKISSKLKDWKKIKDLIKIEDDWDKIDEN